MHLRIPPNWMKPICTKSPRRFLDSEKKNNRGGTEPWTLKHRTVAWAHQAGSGPAFSCLFRPSWLYVPNTPAEFRESSEPRRWSRVKTPAMKVLGTKDLVLAEVLRSRRGHRGRRSRRWGRGRSSCSRTSATRRWVWWVGIKNRAQIAIPRPRNSVMAEYGRRQSWWGINVSRWISPAWFIMIVAGSSLKSFLSGLHVPVPCVGMSHVPTSNGLMADCRLPWRWPLVVSPTYVILLSFMMWGFCMTCCDMIGLSQ